MNGNALKDIGHRLNRKLYRLGNGLFLGVSLWPGGHTRHIERVYCPFGQYAAFAGLWPGGPYALRCRYGLVAIRATLSALHLPIIDGEERFSPVG